MRFSSFLQWTGRFFCWGTKSNHRGTERHRGAQRKAEKERIKGKTSSLLRPPLCISVPLWLRSLNRIAPNRCIANLPMPFPSYHRDTHEDPDQTRTGLFSPLRPAAVRDRPLLLPILAPRSRDGIPQRGGADDASDGPSPGLDPQRDRAASRRGLGPP